MGLRWSPLLLLALLAVPVASAQTGRIVVTLEGEHAEGHVMEVDPESRRSKMDFTVKVRAEGFVCLADTAINVEGSLTFPDEWAGASLNPPNATVPIRRGEPVGEKGYEGLAPITLEMFWGDNHPRTGAVETYTIETRTKLDGCVPSHSIEEDSIQVQAAMADLPPEEEAPEPCEAEDCTGVDLRCQSEEHCSIDPNPVPGLGPVLALLATAAAVLRRRR